MSNGAGDSLSEQDLDELLTGIGEGTPPESAPTPDLSDLEATSAVHKEQAGMGLDQASLDTLVGSLDPSAPQSAEESQALTKDNIADLSALSTPGGAGADKVDNMDILRDVMLRLTVELGGTRMLIKDVLKLSEGSIVELDRTEGDDVDILVNDCLFARGKLKLVDQYFAVQITHIEDTMNQYRKSEN